MQIKRVNAQKYLKQYYYQAKLTDEEEVDMWKDYYLNKTKPKPTSPTNPTQPEEQKPEPKYDPAGFVGGVGMRRMAFSFPKHLRILNSDGSIAFEKDLPGNVAGFVSTDSKGNIIVNNDTGDILSFSPYGAKKWQTKAPPIGWWASVYKDDNGRDMLVCVHNDGVVRGFDTTTGAEVLTLKAISDKLNGLPIKGPDGAFYVSSDKAMYVFKGRIQRWKLNLPGGVRLWPGFAFDDENNHHWVSVVSNEGDLKFVDADKDGLVLWTKKLVNDKFKTPPKMDKDGSVYVYSNHSIYAFNNDGTYKWNPIQFSGNILNGTVSSHGNYLFCATDDKKFRIIDKNSGQILYETTTGSAPMAFWPSVVGNSLFISNQAGKYVIMRLDNFGYVKEFSFDSKINTWPHPDGHGLIYFTTEDGAIHVVDKDGNEIRKLAFDKRKVEGQKDGSK